MQVSSITEDSFPGRDETVTIICALEILHKETFNRRIKEMQITIFNICVADMNPELGA